MKILKKDLRNGVVKLAVETGDDVWYIHTILEEKDFVTGDSEYKMKLSGSSEKSKVAKRRVWVKVQMEKQEFSESTGDLRVTGKVYDGSEEVPRGNYHGLDIRQGTRITIGKEKWYDFHLEKLNDAVQSSNLQTLLVIFDRERALIGSLRPDGFKTIVDMKGDVPKKGMDEQKTHSFYKEIADKLHDLVKGKGQQLIAASPSFWQEYLKKELSPEVLKRTIFSAVSGVDKTAISELLRRPELQQALSGERVRRETEIVDAVMAALAKDALVYGDVDLAKTIEEGNISKFIVTENQIKQARSDDKWDHLDGMMRKASDLDAKIHLLSTKEAMTKIDSLGGKVGIKRW